MGTLTAADVVECLMFVSLFAIVVLALLRPPR